MVEEYYGMMLYPDSQIIMISKSDLIEFYNWASQGNFPMKGNPTTANYSNRKIQVCQLKCVRKNLNIRKKLMTDKIYKIYKNDDILNSNYVVFAGGTILKPHTDPDIYSERYKRIQIPIKVANGSYMLWQGEKVIWEKGVPKCYLVMDHIHEAYNLSDDTMEFLFVDVKVDTVVEL